MSNRVGRPDKFAPKQVKQLKKIVSEYGLRKGRQVLNRLGIRVSLPTLSKYIGSTSAGKPLVLKRGRPLKMEA